MQPIIHMHQVIGFLLLLTQTYSLVFGSLFLLKSLGLLKRPYSGMDYAELLPAAALVAGVFFVSIASAPGIFQSVQTWSGGGVVQIRMLLLFFVRAFVLVSIASLVSHLVGYLHIRYLFKGHFQSPTMAISLLLTVINLGTGILSAYACREAVDAISPKLIILQ